MTTLKSKEEILNQPYMSAFDLKTLMPTVGIDKCRNYIKEIRQEMKENNYIVPESKTKLALTKLVKKKFGL